MLRRYGLSVLDHHRDKTVVKRRWQVYRRRGIQVITKILKKSPNKLHKRLLCPWSEDSKTDPCYAHSESAKMQEILPAMVIQWLLQQFFLKIRNPSLGLTLRCSSDSGQVGGKRILFFLIFIGFGFLLYQHWLVFYPLCIVHVHSLAMTLYCAWSLINFRRYFTLS